MSNLLLSSLFAVALTCCSSPSIGAEPCKQNPEVPLPQEPLTVVELFEIPEAGINRFVAEYAERSHVVGKTAGFITAILYQSLLPDNPYQLIAVEQWQDYDSWSRSIMLPVFMTTA